MTSHPVGPGVGSYSWCWWWWWRSGIVQIPHLPRSPSRQEGLLWRSFPTARLPTASTASLHRHARPPASSSNLSIRPPGTSGALVVDSSPTYNCALARRRDPSFFLGCFFFPVHGQSQRREKLLEMEGRPVSLLASPTAGDRRNHPTKPQSLDSLCRRLAPCSDGDIDIRRELSKRDATRPRRKKGRSHPPRVSCPPGNCRRSHGPLANCDKLTVRNEV
jgi:hypothetical protein